MAAHGAEAVRDAIEAKIATLPEQLAKTLTWDQGAEMAQHAPPRIEAGLDICFCDPRSPWQRGTNENNNGLLRQHFPTLRMDRRRTLSWVWSFGNAPQKALNKSEQRRRK